MSPSDQRDFLQALQNSAVKTIDSTLAMVKGWVHESLETWKDMRWNSKEKMAVFNLIKNQISESLYDWIISKLNERTLDGGDRVVVQKCLGVIYMNRGPDAWDHANSAFQEAVDACNVTKNDVITLVLLSNYTLLLYKTRRFEKAHLICKLCFEMSVQLNGYKCIYTRKELHTLVVLCYRTGKYEEAVQLLHNFLENKEEALGDLADKHFEVFQAMYNLSIIYKKLGRYDDAIRYMTESLAIRKEMLGDEHPYTLALLRNLASLYHITGRADEALRLLGEKAIAGSEQSG